MTIKKISTRLSAYFFNGHQLKSKEYEHLYSLISLKNAIIFYTRALGSFPFISSKTVISGSIPTRPG